MAFRITRPNDSEGIYFMGFQKEAANAIFDRI